MIRHCFGIDQIFQLADVYIFCADSTRSGYRHPDQLELVVCTSWIVMTTKRSRCTLMTLRG